MNGWVTSCSPRHNTASTWVSYVTNSAAHFDSNIKVTRKQVSSRTILWHVVHVNVAHWSFKGPIGPLSPPMLENPKDATLLQEEHGWGGITGGDTGTKTTIGLWFPVQVGIKRVSDRWITCQCIKYNLDHIQSHRGHRAAPAEML